jgi:hypothetical protein
MRQVIIGFENGDHIILKLHGKSAPLTADYWDGNWHPAEIFVKAGAFSGHLSLSQNIQLRSEEFECFLKELEPMYESLKGTAKFATMEDWIELNISGDGRGHMVAKGYIIDEHVDGNKLNFVIKFDQTALPDTIKSLKLLLSDYPVVGR